jgi:hypothetical protein
MKATILLVDISSRIESDDFDFETFTDRMEQKYPDFRSHLKAGDIIENLAESGYRSQGVYMYAGKNIIPLNYDYDDYGSVSTQFLVFKDFPPNYWSPWSDLLVNDTYQPGGKSQAYWHGESGEPVIDKNVLTDAEMSTNNDGSMYVDIEFAGKNYQVLVDKEDLLQHQHDLHVSYCSSKDENGICEVSTG